MPDIVLGTWKTWVLQKGSCFVYFEDKANRISWWIGYEEWYKEKSGMKPSFREVNVVSEELTMKVPLSGQLDSLSCPPIFNYSL